MVQLLGQAMSVLDFRERTIVEDVVLGSSKVKAFAIAHHVTPDWVRRAKRRALNKLEAEIRRLELIEDVGLKCK